MKLKQTLSIILFSFLIFNTNNAQMAEAFNELNEMLAEFDNGDKMIRQEFSVDENKPYEVTLTRVLTSNKKGKEEQEVFSFNIALINPQKIERKTKKNEMSINLKTKDGKFIKHTKDQKSKFDSQLKIITPDIDAARDLEVYLKEIIKMGTEHWDDAIQIPATTEGVNSLITSFGNELKDDENTINQKIQSHEDNANGLMELYRKATQKGKEETESFLFYWGDIDSKSINIKNEGGYQILHIKTKGKQKLIASILEDKIKYESELKLIFSSSSDAIYTSKLIDIATSIGSNVNKESLSKFENCGGNCISMMGENISSWPSEIKNVTMSGECQAIMKIEGKKSDKIEWHWSDINPSSLTVDYNSNDQTVSFKVKDKQKFITYYKDNELPTKYDNAFEFKISDVFSAKSMLVTIPQIIQQCSRDLEVKDMTWMSEYISSVTVDDGKYDQSIAQTDDDCSYMYKLENREKDKEETYEFNLYDLDPKSIKLDISKNRINLNVTSKGKEKLITKYEEAGDLKYVKEIDLRFEDLLSARIAQNTLRKLINSCQ